VRSKKIKANAKAEESSKFHVKGKSSGKYKDKKRPSGVAVATRRRGDTVFDINNKDSWRSIK
jgi:hypothetical protein